jgi:hypothetical protein
MKPAIGESASGAPVKLYSTFSVPAVLDENTVPALSLPPADVVP